MNSPVITREGIRLPRPQWRMFCVFQITEWQSKLKQPGLARREYREFNRGE